MRATIVLFFTVSLLLVGGTALADLSFRIGPGDTVHGTIDPADEVENLVLELPRGAAVSASIKALKEKGAAPPSFRIRMLSEAGTDLQPGATTKLKKVVVPETGLYRIEVTAEGGVSGNFMLKVKVKASKKFGGDVDLGGGNGAFDFAATEGATAKIKVKAAKGSAAQPSILACRYLDGHFVAALGGVKETVPGLPHTGEYRLDLLDDGGAGGGASVSVKVKSLKPEKRKVYLTDDALGAPPPFDVELHGTFIDGAGGQHWGDLAWGDGIVQAGVVVPAGAVNGPTPFLFGKAEFFETPGLGDIEGRGPTIYYSPAGATFPTPVTVAIPFDVDWFAGDHSRLRVIRADSDGTLTVMPVEDYLVDDALGVVYVPTDHFSRFGVHTTFGGGGPPPAADPWDLNGDGDGDLVIATNRNPGYVHVFFGGSSFWTRNDDQADAIFEGPSDFGMAFCTGDLNGDGTADLAASAPWLPSGGKVYLFYGGAGFAGSTDLDADADYVLTGPVGFDFGMSLAAGDVTGDGVPDLLVGAPSTEAVSAGRAYLYPGGDWSGGGAPPGDTFVGAGQFDGFGGMVAIGDVTGEAQPDVVVGATHDGYVAVFAGGPGLAGTGAGSADFLFTADVGDSEFGAHLEVGDVTGDGTGDLVVAGVSTADWLTRVWVFPGGVTGGKTSSAPVRIEPGLTANSMAVGDVDGNGAADIFLGAPFEGGGAMFGYQGGAGLTGTGIMTPDWRIDADESGDFFGQALDVRDVTGDGDADLLVTAYGVSAGANFSGAGFVFAGGAIFPTGDRAVNASIVLLGTTDSGGFGGGGVR